jgi:chromosome segregation ATPase
LDRELERAHGDKNLNSNQLEAQHAADMAALNAENEHMRDLLKNQKVRNKDLDNDVKKLKGDMHALENRAKLLDDLLHKEGQKNDELADENEDLKRQLDAAKALQDHHKKETKKLRDEVANMRSKNDDLARALDDARPAAVRLNYSAFKDLHTAFL